MCVRGGSGSLVKPKTIFCCQKGATLEATRWLTKKAFGKQAIANDPAFGTPKKSLYLPFKTI